MFNITLPYKNFNLVFVFLLSSTTIFFAKPAGAEIYANKWKIENQINHSQLKLSATPELEKSAYVLADASALIANVRAKRILPTSGSNLIQKTQVTDLSTTNSHLPSCPPGNTGEPEFTTVNDLAKTNPQVQSCIPKTISQVQSNIKQLDPLDLPPGLQLEVDELNIDQKSPTEKPPQAEEYIIPPRIADDKKIRTPITTIPVNGVLINHLTQRKLSVGTNFGNTRNTDFDINGVIKINGQIQENLTKNNVLTLDQKAEYLQLQTLRKSREVTVDFKEPQTILGTKIQLSMTASCLFPGSTPDQVCTYTPGLKFSEINPDTLTPTRIVQTAKVGDVVQPETLAAIRQPGFQSGVNGQEIGIDLLLPNIGSFVGNSHGNKTSIDRREEIENTPATTYYRVRQIVKLNDREAVIGRTVQGFNFILNDDNTVLNTALQVAYSFLPDIIPDIADSENKLTSSSKNNSLSPENGGKPLTNGFKPNVNSNLFLAANNVRLPAHSLTAYHGGFGRAENMPQTATGLQQVPAATFNSIWLGASRVIERKSNASSRFQQIGPQTVAAGGGGEGGYDSNVSFFSSVNNQNFSTFNLDNFYTQVYTTNLNQEVYDVTTNKYREEIKYAPHVSFTGNFTATDQATRYYTGVIGAEEIKAYGGLDFKKRTPDRWTFSGGVIAYVNPDIDYYSQASGSVAKVIPFSPNSNLVISSGVNYAFDRETRPNDFVNSITLAARANISDFWFGITNYFGDVLPDSIENILVTGVGIRFSKNFALSAYYNPINENPARSVYGVAGQLKFGTNQDSPILNLSWNNNQYDYGRDKDNNELNINENIFSVFLRGNF
ncbi:Uncharacterized protein apha_00783 [Umezakia ovalisporum]|uniref:hypothetical protein n=1 Tax=Umezakia ovalisporum TaxID=75695 RepID=UPI0006F0F131|nr:Uncharacterized protein apha_00783 [Umezakia ovalisporum]